MYINTQLDWGMISLLPSLVLWSFDDAKEEDAAHALSVHWLCFSINAYWG